MTETLLRAYIPLLLWPGLGVLLFRVLPDTFPRFLGRALYWVGVPLEIFSLIRRASLSGEVGLTPAIAVGALITGLLLAEMSWRGLSWLAGVKSETFPIAVWNPLRATIDGVGAEASSLDSQVGNQRSLQGSFTLTSMLGNTGFVGLAIVPTLVNDAYLSWLVFYSVAHSILGSYGLGVFVASHFGRADRPGGWQRLKDVALVPSLWAFGLGLATRSLPLPNLIETGLEKSIWVIIPLALLLMGMRISQVRSWQSCQLALVPSVIKVGLVPLGVGCVTVAMGLPKQACLALVLMSGMPSAFANLILAEEYELDRDLIATTIAMTTSLILVMIPCWLWLFG